MAFEFRTARGVYRLVAAAPLESDANGFILPVSMERADGIERVVFRCRIAHDLVSDDVSPEALLERLGPWVEHGFEHLREEALKAVRMEQRLMEVMFDAENRGPF
jgi:hypothetical protein